MKKYGNRTKIHTDTCNDPVLFSYRHFAPKELFAVSTGFSRLWSFVRVE